MHCQATFSHAGVRPTCLSPWSSKHTQKQGGPEPGSKLQLKHLGHAWKTVLTLKAHTGWSWCCLLLLLSLLLSIPEASAGGIPSLQLPPCSWIPKGSFSIIMCKRWWLRFSKCSASRSPISFHLEHQAVPDFHFGTPFSGWSVQKATSSIHLKGGPTLQSQELVLKDCNVQRHKRVLLKRSIEATWRQQEQIQTALLQSFFFA